MDNAKSPKPLVPRDVPRRMRLSAREIGVAIALTLAAAAQIWASFGGRDNGPVSRSEQAARKLPAAGGATAR